MMPVMCSGPMRNRMPISSSGRNRGRFAHSTVVSAGARHGGERRGEPLAADEHQARRRVDEQRLERAALALAGRRVGGDLHAADEARHDDEHRDEGQDLRRPLLRRRDLDVLEHRAAATAAGLTPRAIRRRLPISAPYCCSRRRTRSTVGRASLRELSATICSTAGLDWLKVFAKSFGMMIASSSS